MVFGKKIEEENMRCEKYFFESNLQNWLSENVRSFELYSPKFEW